MLGTNSRQADPTIRNDTACDYDEYPDRGHRPVANSTLDFLIGATRAWPDRKPHLGEDFRVTYLGFIWAFVKLAQCQGALAATALNDHGSFEGGADS